MKKLSILICHLTERKKLLRRLLAHFMPQVCLHMRTELLSDYYEFETHVTDVPWDSVEILVEEDNGRITTGEKRNRLLERAQAEYVACFDDDDIPSPDYVQKVLTAIKTEPDVVGIEGLIYLDINAPRKFIHSLEVKEWHEKKINGEVVYLRFPNHLNPVKRELALKTGFKKISHGEDHDYSTRLLPLLKSEVMISGNPIYHYYP